MAYKFNYNNDELGEEDLDFGMGGTYMSYEEAKEYALLHGLANARHGGNSNGELPESDLDNIRGVQPFYEEETRRKGR